MNFRPELAAAVMARRKTVTRRLVSDNPRSPWWHGGCALKVGRDYAVCPGRGKNAIGRVVIVSAELQTLGWLDSREASREGFAGPVAFEQAWRAINGNYSPDVFVWRVAFEAIR